MGDPYGSSSEEHPAQQSIRQSEPLGGPNAPYPPSQPPGTPIGGTPYPQPYPQYPQYPQYSQPLQYPYPVYPPYQSGPLMQPSVYVQPMVVQMTAGPTTSGWAIASLICSILGWIGLVGIGSLLGVIFGHVALGEIKNSNGRVEGHGLAMAGLILGYIALAFGVLGLCIFFLFIIGLMGAAANQ
ncbi:MAG TPA: DUF4190 domain-containing protein [Ktedonobacterales bacterium]|nr:DUF4190 domain-containing protein [Ktedonobacterales bacterium]